MRSEHVDQFNHDPWAANYDRNVLNEDDPIRAGYAAVLDWTAASARVTPGSVVLDLGSGSGNTSARLPAADRLICVDVSPRMTELAKPKLAHLPNVEYVISDMLEYVCNSMPNIDALVSTYALHHLTDDEKYLLFRQVWPALSPGGRAVFGDLMFASAKSQTDLTEAYLREGQTDLVLDFEEEFFWLVDQATAALESAGFQLVQVRRFSALSWGICVQKPGLIHRGRTTLKRMSCGENATQGVCDGTKTEQR